jgi:hypothetical protein
MQLQAQRKLFSRQVLLGSTAVLIYLALVKLLLHFLTNQRYGYFRDELYHVICGERLAWGYVDQAPLIALVARVTRFLLGDSLFALRFFPAIAGALLVLLTGLMVRQLGGGRFAQVLAAVAVIIVPTYLLLHTVLTMNAFEPLLWMLAVYLLILIINHGDARLWLLFGLVAGVGLMNKHSMLFFGFALFVGLLLTPQRKFLLDKWFWLGGLVAGIIFLPHVLWQIRHDWPTIELLTNVQATKNYWVSPFEFLKQQIIFTHPLAFALALIGLVYVFVSRQGKPYRILGWAFVVMLATSIYFEAKAYYLSPIYPMLFAAGAVALERLIQRPGGSRNWNWLQPVTLSLLLVGGAIMAPLALPLLPVETLVDYLEQTGIGDSFRTENQRLGSLPQHFADMFGWEEMAATVAQVYDDLSPEEQAQAVVLTKNYGQAGAINFLGRSYGLPPAISGHQNYFLWGPGDHTGQVLITIGYQREDIRYTYDRVEFAASTSSAYAMPGENNLPIYVCRGIKTSLQEIWPRLQILE